MIIVRKHGKKQMTEQEYIEMYKEFCLESGEQPAPKGFAEFVAWRKRVEKFFQANKAVA